MLQGGESGVAVKPRSGRRESDASGGVPCPRPQRRGPAGDGVATAINFQPTTAGKAAITGNFVLTAGKANPVIRALRADGIAVTALHSHMLTEEPRLFFMHFWANDDPAKLTRGLRVQSPMRNSLLV